MLMSALGGDFERIFELQALQRAEPRQHAGQIPRGPRGEHFEHRRGRLQRRLDRRQLVLGYGCLSGQEPGEDDDVRLGSELARPSLDDREKTLPRSPSMSPADRG